MCSRETRAAIHHTQTAQSPTIVIWMRPMKLISFSLFFICKNCSTHPLIVPLIFFVRIFPSRELFLLGIFFPGNIPFFGKLSRETFVKKNYQREKAQPAFISVTKFENISLPCAQPCISGMAQCSIRKFPFSVIE